MTAYIWCGKCDDYVIADEKPAPFPSSRARYKDGQGHNIALSTNLFARDIISPRGTA